MELYIPPKRLTRNPKNGQFLKGHIPFNKGKKWDDFFPKEAQERARERLKQGRKGNLTMHGWNKRAVVGVAPNGLFVRYESGAEAGRRLKIQARNIMRVANKERKTAGGLRWFFEEDNAWIELVEQLKNAHQ